MLARKHKYFVSDAHREWEQQNLHCRNSYGVEKIACKHTSVGKNVSDEHTDNYSDEYHKKHKAGSATGVEALMLFRIFGGKLVSRLKAGNGLMLGTVILEGAVYVGYKRGEEDVEKENYYLHCAFNKSQKIRA